MKKSTLDDESAISMFVLSVSRYIKHTDKTGKTGNTGYYAGVRVLRVFYLD